MYSTCLHCHRSLGSNDAVEHLPIGRRIAFDAEKGRLWVVCRHCGRWNLTPIEERWEAVEESEKLFRAQRLRAQTDNVGLAKLKEGTELIRIGKPLRPEFAAWRYGAVFRRRLLKTATLASGAAATIVSIGIAAAGGAVGDLLVPILFLPIVPGSVALLQARLHSTALGTKVVGEDGKALDVTIDNLEHTRLMVGDDGKLRVALRHSYGQQELTGDRARRAMATLLARINRSGALADSVTDAVEFMTVVGGPDKTIAAIAAESRRRAGDFEELSALARRAPTARTVREAIAAQMEIQQRVANHRMWSSNNTQLRNPGALHHLPRAMRLALEMSVHEASEQKALEEDLSLLERDWREAEEIAAIADGLLTPRTTASG
jgi:hypothetical protein